MFCIVLPTRGLYSNKNNSNYFPLIMKQYDKFLDHTKVSKFIIITPDLLGMYEYLEPYSKKFNFLLLSDGLFIDDKLFNHLNNKGWYKQQVIKMLSSIYVDTDLYLIVDDDLFLTKSLTYDDLFSDNKIKFLSEQFEDFGKPNFSSLNWLIGSCKFHNYDINNLKNKKLMSVTPEIIVTKYMKDLVTERKEGESWIQKFIETKATEYLTYWIYLIKINATDIYTDLECLWSNDPDYNILEYHADIEKCIKNGFSKDNKNHFMVIQSYLMVDYKRVENVINSL